MYRKLLLVLLIFGFTACSKVPSLNKRVETANKILDLHRVNRQVIKTINFDFFLLKSRVDKNCNTLRLYIEGDGLSWISSSIVSKDPTPINPLAMRLFSKDSEQCIAYVARPCQYIKNSNCNKRYWTNARFSKKVVSAYVELLNILKENNNFKSIELIGYSGGATIALLIASQRDDIIKVTTVAGNLNHSLWTKNKGYTSLYNSLNPIDFINKLRNIKQVHFIGKEDKVIQKSVSSSYLNYFKSNPKVKSIIFKGFSHHQGWVENWPELLEL